MVEHGERFRCVYLNGSGNVGDCIEDSANGRV